MLKTNNNNKKDELLASLPCSLCAHFWHLFKFPLPVRKPISLDQTPSEALL